MTVLAAEPNKKRAGIDYSKFDNIEDSDDEKTTVSPNSEEKQVEAQKPHCQNCHKDILKPLRCGVCKKVSYCTTQCQKDDWQFHKRVCKKPEEPKAEEKAKKELSPEEKERRKQERVARKAEDKVVENDENLTWYRHREWKPTEEPKKEFTPVQINSSSAQVEAVPTAANGQAMAGSVWNAAGTWEEKDVTAMARKTLKESLEGIPDTDVAGGVVSVTSIDDIEGDASKPVIRGKLRHIFDLSFKANIAFKWMESDGQQQITGTITVNDFTNDTFAENVLSPPSVELAFKDSKLLGNRRQAVEASIGASSWPPIAGSVMEQVASRMKAWAKDYEQVS